DGIRDRNVTGVQTCALPILGIAKTSGSFLMVRDDERYVFADCAINIAPGSQDLAEIALTSAHTAQLFGIDPRIAMLSFSTKGSRSEERRVGKQAERCQAREG